MTMTDISAEVMGERYIGCGDSGRRIRLVGTAGNALGAYLDGSEITLEGNAQEAAGDTMNDGVIVINGSVGDTAGYSMRGGKIFVRGNTGYRTGIHMKAYKEKLPVIVIGGRTGSFLGEYQAGGIIIVLGLGCEDVPVGYFCGTGMHGGKIYLRTDKLPHDLPPQVLASKADDSELAEIMPYIDEFSEHFGISRDEIMAKSFYVLKPNSRNPYKQLYCAN